MKLDVASVAVVADTPLAIWAALLLRVTVLLAFAWIVHSLCARGNPRWRVLVWRTVVVASICVCALSALPPLLSVPILPEGTVRWASPFVSARDTDRSAGGMVSEVGSDGRFTAVDGVVRLSPTAATQSNNTVSAQVEVATTPDAGQTRASVPVVGRKGAEKRQTPSSSLTMRLAAALRQHEAWLGVWLVGVVILAVRTMVGIARLRRIRATASTVPEAVERLGRTAAEKTEYRRQIDLRQSAAVSTPCLIGLRRPTIILPGDRFQVTDRNQLEAILLHECAHLQQRDLWWNTACHLWSIAFWFHPLAWRLRAAHADACDAVADALAAHYLGSATEYARTLARLAVQLQSPVPAAALAMARVSNVRARVERLQRTVFSDPLPRGRAAAVSASGLAFALLLGTGVLTSMRPATGMAAGAANESAHPKSPEAAQSAPDALAQVDDRDVPADPVVESQDDFVGLVLTDDGTPASEARVTAAAVFRSPPLRIETATDNQGRFRLTLPKVNGSTRYSLAVRWHDQGVDVWDTLDVSGEPTSIQGQQLPPATIRLRTQGTLRGRVLKAEDGQPLAGARLFLDSGEVLTTDNAGVFEVSGLPLKDHNLIPVAPGRVRQYVLFDTTNRPEAELELRLPRGALVRGQVVDEAGRPIPGAYLRRSSSGTALTLNGWDEVCEADGSFEYSGLSPERLFYSLEAAAPGYKSSPVSVQVRSADDVFERTIVLTKKPSDPPTDGAKVDVAAAPAAALPRRTITGLVRDPDGKPVAGATVRWGLHAYDQSVKDAITNAEGVYSLSNVPDRDGGAVLVMAGGFAHQFVSLKSGLGVVNATLTRGVPVRGVITGSSGTPVAGVQVIPVVRCFETGLCNPIWLHELETTTNEQGEFEIASVPPVGTTFDILKEGYSEQRGVTLKTGDEVNAVQLSAGGAATGVVVDEHGAPVRNFKIRVMIPRNLQPNEPAGGYYAGYDWYGVRFTDDTGRFIMTGMGAGASLRLVVTSPGIGRAVIDRVRTVSLDQLNTAEPLTVRLKPFAPLHVRVLSSETGQPVEGAAVGLMEDELRATGPYGWGYDDLWMSRTWTEAGGQALFAEPEADDGTVIVTAPGYARKRVAWAEGTSEIEVALAPGATVSGTVVIEGAPLAEGYVSLRTTEGEGISAQLRETPGQFRLEGLSAGEYELTISDANGQQVYHRTVDLRPGEQQLDPIEATQSAPAADQELAQ